MRTVMYIPPLPRMSGGIAVLYQLAERLRESGRECAFVTSGAPSGDGAPGLAAQLEKGFEQLEWSAGGNFLSPEDIYLVPEGWPNALAPGFAAKCRCAVYVQNWAYLLSGLPSGVRWDQLPVTFIAVSQPVAWFIKEIAHLPVAGIVRPALAAGRFGPRDKKPEAIRIAWMPRKNKALAEQIRAITEASLVRDGLPPLEWVELHRMSPDEVADGLGSSHIFLCTGFPEGFALPPLEAMASGCLVVGFSGFGGWDYMREARSASQFSPYPPYLPLRETVWGGNGFFAMDGDVVSAAFALKEAVRLVAKGDPFAESITDAARMTARCYSPAAQQDEVAAVWNILES